MFKKIQEANSLIGDPDSRRSYDLFGSRRGTSSSSSSSPFTSASFWDDLQRQRQRQRQQQGGSGSSTYERNPRYQNRFRDENVEAFYRAFSGASQRGYRSDPPFFGFSSSSSSGGSFGNDLFRGRRSGGDGGGLFSSFGVGKSPSFKMKYVQKIKVPLSDLYKGKSNMEFQLQETLWKRYCAVFRGGLGYLILYQSFLFAAPLLRLSKWIALAVGALVFHANVPQHNNPNNSNNTPFLDDNHSAAVYTTDILAGYKEGTRITFSNEETNTDVVFVLEEDYHDIYWREGNELHATIDILASQAKDGCSISLESLNPIDEDPIQIKLRPHQIQQSGDTLTLPNKGWPQRQKQKNHPSSSSATSTTKGDLIIHFRIVRKMKKKNHTTKTSASHSNSSRRRRTRKRKKPAKKESTKG